MALKSTIYKADLQVADMDRGYYADHALTLARHPSETEERLMVRLLSFALYAAADLTFGKGLCADDEPDLWCKTLTDEVSLWIEVGLPDEKWLRKASARAARVVVVAYGGRQAEVWWSGIRDKLARCSNLEVIALPGEATQALAAMVERGMRLQFTRQDGMIWLTDGQRTVTLEPLVWRAPG